MGWMYGGMDRWMDKLTEESEDEQTEQWIDKGMD